MVGDGRQAPVPRSASAACTGISAPLPHVWKQRALDCTGNAASRSGQMLHRWPTPDETIRLRWTVPNGAWDHCAQGPGTGSVASLIRAELRRALRSPAVVADKCGVPECTQSPKRPRQHESVRSTDPRPLCKVVAGNQEGRDVPRQERGDRGIAQGLDSQQRELARTGR